MAENSVVLVTGVSGYWGSQVSARLQQNDKVVVIGFDNIDPEQEIPGIETKVFAFEEDKLSSFLSKKSVNTICHLKWEGAYDEQEAELLENTVNLLNACANTNVKRVIIPSSTVVYGAHRTNPAFFREDSGLMAKRSSNNARYFLEIEDIGRRFSKQYPQIKLLSARFANIVGKKADSPWVRYLNQNRPKVLLGFDPMIQLIHEDDVVEALVQGVIKDWSGTYNFGAEGSMPLSRIIRILRKLPIPVFHPLVLGRNQIFNKKPHKPAHTQPVDWDYLRYSCVADLGKMREDLSFFPEYSAEAALRDFSGSRATDNANDS